MGGGHFAGRERLNLNSRNLQKNADSEKEKSEKSQKQNLYLEKNSSSRKSENNSHEKNLLKKFLKQKFYRLKFLHKFHSRFFENSNHGTILIEFAFCVPVLILLLLYINDIMTINRIANEAKQAGYVAVQLIQNVSKNRPNKLITKKDMLNITRAWLMMIPCIQTMIKIGNFHIATIVTLVEGSGDDICKVKWVISSHMDINAKKEIALILTTAKSTSPNWGYNSLSKYAGKEISMNKDLNSTYLYEDLHIKNKEMKAIVEINIENVNRDNGKSTEKAFGLYMLKKPLGKIMGGDKLTCFFTHVIFTPINGIFTTTTPPQ